MPGHEKPTHLPLHVACMEHGGVALVTRDLVPSDVLRIETQSSGNW